MDIKARTEAVKKKMAEATRVVPEEAGLETVDSRHAAPVGVKVTAGRTTSAAPVGVIAACDAAKLS